MVSWRGTISFMPTARMLRQAEQSKWTLKQFLDLSLSRPKADERFFFSEESVVSVGYRYNGRFDGAILHWENVPVLDAIIERKFPASHLPETARPEDFFQAGLYALALMEKGVSCSSTKLAILYCLQDDARKCLDRNENKCFTCSSSKVFERRFKPRSAVKNLKKFDDFWYRNAKPKPSPDRRKCGTCPNGKNGTCNYSAA